MDFIAQVQLEQTYQNDTDITLQAVYHFPVFEQAALCDFQAKYSDGTTVQGVVKEKQAAREEYQRAIREQGKQAQLLESVRRDVLTLRVGNLGPQQVLKVCLTYVTTL